MKQSMPFKLFGFLLAMLAFAGTLHPHDSFAGAHKTKKSTPHYVRHKSSAVNTRGYSDIVIEAETGRILHSSDPEKKLYPASLTKMMTLYLTFQALESGKISLNQKLWVSRNASEQSPSKLGLRPGQSIEVDDAILSLVTESANDSAVVIAEALGGSEGRFAQMMTTQAKALGMSSTTFRNPSGLPDNSQVTCAADMARLGYALIYHYPQYYHYFSREQFVYGGIAHNNHNHLMERYDGMDGIKTGYIRAAGFNLVASATKGNTRIIGAVMGGKTAVSRDNQMEKLLDSSFSISSPYGSYKAAHLNAGYTSQGDAGTLEAGDYLDLPEKTPVVFAPRQQPQVIQRRVSAGSSPLSPHLIIEAQNDQPQEQPEAPQIAAEPVDTYNQVATQPDEDNASKDLSQQTPVKPPETSETKKAKGSVTKVSSAKKVAKGKWGIQIGAFADKDSGQQAIVYTAQSLPKSLDNADAVVQKVMIDGSAVYRARLMGLGEKTARATCRTLIKQGKDCLIVLPTRR